MKNVSLKLPISWNSVYACTGRLFKMWMIYIKCLAHNFASSVFQELRKATSCGFGFSYGLGWVALIMSFATFCLFLFVAIKVYLSSRSPYQHKLIPRKIAHPEPPKQPLKPLTQQGLTYSFFHNVAHHSDQPIAYPIPYNPYDLHLPTGISPNELRFPNYGELPGKFYRPMVYSNTRVNY